MRPEDLSDDLVRFMRLVLERGGTECSGTCHHRKPGEVHCHALGRDLKISSSGVKERILTLARMGLLEREKLERPGTYALVRFTVSAEGKRALAARKNCSDKEKGFSMAHPMHDSVVDLIQKSTTLMDRLLRGHIDIEEYADQLKALDVDSVLVAYEPEFKEDPGLVYYLDALMLLSSLQHELEFQVAEYGSNVALEDMRNLEELLKKFLQT